MAYPLQCHAGYPMPLKAGKFEVLGFFAAPAVVGTAMEVAIIDDRTIKNGDIFGKLIPSMDPTVYDSKTCIAWEKTGAGYNASHEFGEPIKVRYGISVYSTNVAAGSLCVYVR